MTQTLAFATMAASLAMPAHANQVEASKMRYQNNGSYSAIFRVTYRREYNGETVTCRIEPRKSMLVQAGRSKSVDLTGNRWWFRSGFKEACLINGRIPEGIEVWARLDIEWGDGSSCRKSKKVIYSPSGGTMKYKSSGTTRQNNRCKVDSWP